MNIEREIEKVKAKIVDKKAEIDCIEGNIVTCTFPMRKIELANDLHWACDDLRQLEDELFDLQLELIEDVDLDAEMEALADSYEPSTIYPRC